MAECISYGIYPTERPEITQYSILDTTLLSIFALYLDHQTTAFTLFAFLHSLGRYRSFTKKKFHLIFSSNLTDCWRLAITGSV
jgi:hypothetical protein